MGSLLVLGFLFGIRHAMEADHVAAVASLATSHAHSVRSVIRQGMAWGLGHALTLSLFGGIVLFAEAVIPQRLANGLDFVVGLMLVALGADVLRRLFSGRVRIHSHPGSRSLHVHTHGPDGASGKEPLPMRALAVGLMHGMAGSAALILLALSTVKSVSTGLLYMGVFGLGSMAGMAMLSVALALPLHYSERVAGSVFRGVHGVVGIGTLLLGATMAYRMAAGGLFGLLAR